jgi:flagellar basal-body rod modification protein FlgD
MITTAQSVTAFKSTPPDKLERVPMKTLGQDDFLKLLVVQMRNQDPLKPVSDTEFIAQLAQFSNLEQTKQMSGDIAELRQSSAFAQAAALMGRQVRLLSGNDTFTNGFVTELEVMEGEVSLIVNGKAYELGQVVAVNSEETAEESAEENKNTNH